MRRRTWWERATEKFSLSGIPAIRGDAPVGGALVDCGKGAEGLEPAEAVLETDEPCDGFTHSICPEIHSFVSCLNGKCNP